MRYILSLALIFAACTRANPEAVGGNGGSGGGGVAGSGGGGAGGGSAGSGGAGGGGGVAGDHDMAMSMARDMATRPDMATLDGVACGAVSCTNGDDCCVNNNGSHCTSQQQCTGGSHPTLWACDGPEDCKSSNGGIGGMCCANSSGSACDITCSGLGTPSSPMCHSLDDCPANAGYTACCPVPVLTQYKVCSNQACP